MIIHVVAGPPGIGKSTNAKELIPVGVPIIDQDLAAYQYKRQGFTNYQDIASLSSNQKIKDFLFAQESFALELNLGFPSHYDYLRSIARFNPANQVHLLLFFTDDLILCLDRAKIRHLNGGHEVKPDIIEEMYHSTMPLFEENKSLFHKVRLVDVTDTAIIPYAYRAKNLPNWIVANGLTKYLKRPRLY